MLSFFYSYVFHDWNEINGEAVPKSFGCHENDSIFCPEAEHGT